MEFKLQYVFNNETYSIGFIQNEEKTFKAFVIADPPRDQKIKKKTRFKAGRYPLKIRKENTELTIKHRSAYNIAGDEWFKYHIEVTGIPEFSGCYVHSGIDALHTDGCVLLMYIINLTVEKNQGSVSLKAVKDFYSIVYPLLEAGKECWLIVNDELN